MKIKHILAVLVVFVAVGAGLLLGVRLGSERAAEEEPEITSHLVMDRLETAKDLTTAKLTYNGLIYYEDGKIPLLTKKAFFMTYCANVEAVYDLRTVAPEITETEVIITLPGVMTRIYVDTDSIQFYDKSAALLNWTEKDDAVNAIKAAQEDVMAQPVTEELKTTAREQVEQILRELIEPVLDEGMTLVVQDCWMEE